MTRHRGCQVPSKPTEGASSPAPTPSSPSSPAFPIVTAIDITNKVTAWQHGMAAAASREARGLCLRPAGGGGAHLEAVSKGEGALEGLLQQLEVLLQDLCAGIRGRPWLQHRVQACLYSPGPPGSPNSQGWLSLPSIYRVASIYTSPQAAPVNYFNFCTFFACRFRKKMKVISTLRRGAPRGGRSIRPCAFLFPSRARLCVYAGAATRAAPCVRRVCACVCASPCMCVLERSCMSAERRGEEGRGECQEEKGTRAPG